MKLGVHLPQWGADADRAGVLMVARAAEAAGLDSVWVADHVVHPAESVSRYPYREQGIPFGADEGFLEAFTTLALVAGATERVRLGTSVLILPMRDPLLTAKTTATLDALSHGRLVLGIGAGWWAEEFAALDAPFAERGSRMDEQLAILRQLWSGTPVGFSGKSYKFDKVVCRPTPMQPGGPPLLIGGMTNRALRRAAELGDGWHAVGAAPGQIREGVTTLARLCERADRDPATITVSSSNGLGRDSDRAIRRLEALGEAGADLVVLNVGDNTAPGIVRGIEQIFGEIAPRLACT